MARLGAFLVVVSLVGAGVAGCIVSESDTIRTSGMWVHFAVEQISATDAVAWADFRVSAPLGNVIDLTGGDRIECNGVRLTEYFEPITGYHWNRGEIDVSAAGYDFTFIRPDEEVSTHVDPVDEPFIDGTDPADTFGPSDQLTVWWDDFYPADSITIDVYGECITGVTETGLEDDGEYTLAEIAADVAHPPPCDVELTVTRHLYGDVSPAFKDGSTDSYSASGDTLGFAP